MNVLKNLHLFVRFLFLLTLILGVGAACRGETNNAASDVPASTVVVVEPLEPTAVPPTEAPPAEAPSEPTSLPEPTATSAPEATEAVVEMPEGIALGNCANPYFPVVEGRVLSYQSTGPDIIGTTSYSMTFSDVSESSFTTTSTFEEGEVLSQVWTCTADGLVTPYLMQLPGMDEEEDMGFEIEYDDVTGITIPPADQMRPGGSWTTQFVARMTFLDEDMVMNQTMDMEHQVTAIESVTVPAGTFDNAVRVETTSNISSVMNFDGQEMPGMSMTIDFVSWYVEGVGLVRDETVNLFNEGAEGALITELIAIE
jgi:hypothetical protein